MTRLLLVLLFVAATAHAENLTSVIVSAGSPVQFFSAACDGKPYKLVEKDVNAYVVKTYLFIAANAPAVDAWLYTDTGQIIGEVHKISGKHPSYPDLNYWESERDFRPDSMWVGKVWVLALCYSGTSIEPYAVIYTRGAP